MGLGEVVDVLVVDPPVDVPVGVDLVLPVGDDVRDDDLVVDDEADVAGEDLVAVRHEGGAVYLHAVLLEHGLEGAHLGDDVLFGGVGPVQDGFVGFAVEGLRQGRDRPVRPGHSEDDFPQAGGFVDDV